MKKIFTVFALVAVVLTGCGPSDRVVEVELTTEQVAFYEAEVEKWDELIRTPIVCEEEVVVEAEEMEEPAEEILNEEEVAESGEIVLSEDEPESGVVESEGLEYEIIENCDTRPDFDYFVEKARALANLGQIGEAIKTYDEAFEYYEISSVGWHNLGRLYDQLGEDELAAAEYQKLVDTFKLVQYYRDIARSLERAGEIEAAREAYGSYVSEFGGEDSSLARKLGLQN